MGFLGSIGSFFSGAAKTVAKTVTNPAKLTTAVLTGGASLVAPKITKPLETAVKTTLFNPQLATAVLTKGASLVPSSPIALGGAQPMALDIGGILSGVSNIFKGGNVPAPLQILGQSAGLASQFFPMAGPSTSLAARPVLPAATAAGAAAMRAVPMVGRRFFEKFPNLATAIQGWRNRGVQISRAKLHSLLKRFGPEVLITGGILTAAAVSELMMAGPGTRRMNPGNVKALRRSMRRLESFHRLCVTADRLRRPRSRSCKTPRGAGTQFVRQG